MERKTAVNKKLFPLTKLHKKRKRKSFLWILQTECSKNLFTPSFGNTMLYAVLFIRCVCKYAGEAVGNLFFFWRWQKEGREMLFLFFRWQSVGHKTKCAFSFAVGFLIYFFCHIGRIEFSDGRM